MTADDWAKGAESKWQQGAPASHNIDVRWSQPSDFDELAVHYFGFNSAADQEILDAPRKLIAAEWSSGRRECYLPGNSICLGIGIS